MLFGEQQLGEFTLQKFSGRAFGDIRDEMDGLGAFEIGEPGAAVVDDLGLAH